MKKNQLKLDGYDTYEKDQKTTRNFEFLNDEDVINEAYPDD